MRVLIGVIAALLLALAGAWYLLDRTGQRLATAQRELQHVTAQADSLRKTLRLQRELAAEAEDLDRMHSASLAAARADADRLAADLADSRKRLRVTATCTARVPETASTTRVDDGAEAELTQAARQDYLSLRRRLTENEAALAGLQDYVRRICLSK